MSLQEKKPSKKTKESPNGNQIMDNFFMQKRAKSSRTVKPVKGLSQDGKENQEGAPCFYKESIPYIDKQIFTDNFLDVKNKIPEVAENGEPTQETVDLNSGDENKIVDETKKEFDLTTGLGNKFLPAKYLFREKESKAILSFIGRCTKENCYNTLLVSGPPGTGKTTVLTHILRKLEVDGLETVQQAEFMEDETESVNYQRDVSVIKVNGAECEGLSSMLLEVIKAINEKIPLSVGEYMTNPKVLIDKVKQILLSKKTEKLTVVLIDEVDAFLGKTNIAKDIVELLRIPRYPFSNLIFIVASNIPDLCSKLGEQFKANIELEQVVFEPYTPLEASLILKDRLEELDLLNKKAGHKKIFNKIDIEECFNKMTSLKDTDIRHVLRIIQKLVRSNDAPANSVDDENKASIPSSPKPVSEDDILRAYEELYDNKVSSAVASMSQKHLMCLTAIVMLLAKKGGDMFVKKDLFNMYNSMCSKIFLQKVDLIGLTELLGLLENHKIIELKPKEVDNGVVKKSPTKTPLKNANDEYQLLVSPETITLVLKQDGYFIKFFDTGKDS